MSSRLKILCCHAVLFLLFNLITKVVLTQNGKVSSTGANHMVLVQNRSHISSEAFSALPQRQWMNLDSDPKSNSVAVAKNSRFKRSPLIDSVFQNDAVDFRALRRLQKKHVPVLLSPARSLIIKPVKKLVQKVLAPLAKAESLQQQAAQVPDVEEQIILIRNLQKVYPPKRNRARTRHSSSKKRIHKKHRYQSQQFDLQSTEEGYKNRPVSPKLEHRVPDPDLVPTKLEERMPDVDPPKLEERVSNPVPVPEIHNPVPKPRLKTHYDTYDLEPSEKNQATPSSKTVEEVHVLEENKMSPPLPLPLKNDVISNYTKKPKKESDSEEYEDDEYSDEDTTARTTDTSNPMLDVKEVKLKFHALVEIPVEELDDGFVYDDQTAPSKTGETTRRSILNNAMTTRLRHLPSNVQAVANQDPKSRLSSFDEYEEEETQTQGPIPTSVPPNAYKTSTPLDVTSYKRVTDQNQRKTQVPFESDENTSFAPHSLVATIPRDAQLEGYGRFATTSALINFQTSSKLNLLQETTTKTTQQVENPTTFVTPDEEPGETSTTLTSIPKMHDYTSTMSVTATSHTLSTIHITPREPLTHFNEESLFKSSSRPDSITLPPDVTGKQTTVVQKGTQTKSSSKDFPSSTGRLFPITPKPEIEVTKTFATLVSTEVETSQKETKSEANTMASSVTASYGQKSTQKVTEPPLESQTSKEPPAKIDTQSTKISTPTTAKQSTTFVKNTSPTQSQSVKKMTNAFTTLTTTKAPSRSSTNIETSPNAPPTSPVKEVQRRTLSLTTMRSLAENHASLTTPSFSMSSKLDTTKLTNTLITTTITPVPSRPSSSFETLPNPPTISLTDATQSKTVLTTTRIFDENHSSLPTPSLAVNSQPETTKMMSTKISSTPTEGSKYVTTLPDKSTLGDIQKEPVTASNDIIKEASSTFLASSTTRPITPKPEGYSSKINDQRTSIFAPSPLSSISNREPYATLTETRTRTRTSLVSSPQPITTTKEQKLEDQSTFKVLSRFDWSGDPLSSSSVLTASERENSESEPMPDLVLEDLPETLRIGEETTKPGKFPALQITNSPIRGSSTPSSLSEEPYSSDEDNGFRAKKPAFSADGGDGRGALRRSGMQMMQVSDSDSGINYVLQKNLNLTTTTEMTFESFNKEQLLELAPPLPGAFARDQPFWLFPTKPTPFYSQRRKAQKKVKSTTATPTNTDSMPVNKPVSDYGHITVTDQIKANDQIMVSTINSQPVTVQTPTSNHVLVSAPIHDQIQVSSPNNDQVLVSATNKTLTDQTLTTKQVAVNAQPPTNDQAPAISTNNVAAPVNDQPQINDQISVNQAFPPSDPVAMSNRVPANDAPPANDPITVSNPFSVHEAVAASDPVSKNDSLPISEPYKTITLNEDFLYNHPLELQYHNLYHINDDGGHHQTHDLHHSKGHLGENVDPEDIETWIERMHDFHDAVAGYMRDDFFVYRVKNTTVDGVESRFLVPEPKDSKSINIPSNPSDIPQEMARSLLPLSPQLPQPQPNDLKGQLSAVSQSAETTLKPQILFSTKNVDLDISEESDFDENLGKSTISKVDPPNLPTVKTLLPLIKQSSKKIDPMPLEDLEDRFVWEDSGNLTKKNGNDVKKGGYDPEISARPNAGDASNEVTDQLRGSNTQNILETPLFNRNENDEESSETLIATTSPSKNSEVLPVVDSIWSKLHKLEKTAPIHDDDYQFEDTDTTSAPVEVKAPLNKTKEPKLSKSGGSLSRRNSATSIPFHVKLGPIIPTTRKPQNNVGARPGNNGQNLKTKAQGGQGGAKNQAKTKRTQKRKRKKKNKQKNSKDSQNGGILNSKLIQSIG